MSTPNPHDPTDERWAEQVTHDVKPYRVVLKKVGAFADYMVFLPDHPNGGAREIGRVTLRTTGYWDKRGRDQETSRLAYRRRREAVDMLVTEFLESVTPIVVTPITPIRSGEES